MRLRDLYKTFLRKKDLKSYCSRYYITSIGDEDFAEIRDKNSEKILSRFVLMPRDGLLVED